MLHSPLRHALLILVFLFLFSCTRTVTSYTPTDNEVQWVEFGVQSRDGAAFFIDTDNDSLLILARAEISTTIGEMDQIKLVDVDIKDLSTSDPEIGVAVTVAYGGGHVTDFATPDWSSALKRLSTLEGESDTSAVVLSYERRFRISDFPPQLQLTYKITVRDTTLSGTVRYDVVKRDDEGVMRWH
jgi:hypothetical protein